MIPGVRLVILGKQGAGKGTQCVRLSRHYVVPHISTGDMFRAATKAGSELGRSVAQFLDDGELIPDDVVVSVVRDRLTHPDTKGRGFILDGFPRTVFQADRLSEMLNPKPLDLVIDIEVPTSMVLERLATRRVCIDCHTNYPPSHVLRMTDVCDVCGGEVIHRRDDNAVAIQHRLELYEQQTFPLIDYYRRKSKLVQIDGVGDPSDVTDRCVTAIEIACGRSR